MPQNPATSKPNILLIMSDQHRADILGCAGDPVVRTPNIDRLAREGIRFDRVYCQGPLCMPARSSLLTERYVRDHGVFQNNWDCPADLPTFVGDVSLAGYRTSCIGKMHLWAQGGRRNGRRTTDTRERVDLMRAYGFDEPIETVGKLSSVVVASEYSDHLEQRGLYRTYQEWVAQRSYSRRTEVSYPLSTTSPNPVSGDDYIDAWHGRRVERWLEEYDRAEPFFQWVGFPGPHDPWDAPEDYLELYRNVEMPMPASLERPEPPQDERFRLFLDYFLNVHSDSPNLTDPVIADIRRAYYANVTLIDEAIGWIVGALERRGMLDDTWVIYTSDHGEMMGEHRMLAKMVFYEPAVRVPLIIRPPGGCPARVVPDMVEHLDLSATIRAIAGSTGNPTFEGKSLLGWADSGVGYSRPAVWSENYGLGMVRTPSHKLVFLEDDVKPVQMFDLQSDPLEEANVVDSGEHRQARDELMGTVVRPFLSPGARRPGPGIFDRFSVVHPG